MRTVTVAELRAAQEELFGRANREDTRWYNGVFARWTDPVVTAAHVPLEWRYDLNPVTNRLLVERLGGERGLEPPARSRWTGRSCWSVGSRGLTGRVSSLSRRSATGVDGFRFRDEPITMPETEVPDTNVYATCGSSATRDGWIYGLFCTERKDTASAELSAAVAQAGLARTRDLKTWERLPDLVTSSPRSSATLCSTPSSWTGSTRSTPVRRTTSSLAGSGGGIGWGLAGCDGSGGDRVGDGDRTTGLPHDHRGEER